MRHSTAFFWKRLAPGSPVFPGRPHRPPHTPARPAHRVQRLKELRADSYQYRSSQRVWLGSGAGIQTKPVRSDSTLGFRNEDSPSAAAEAAVGPIIVVRHYCCCVGEEGPTRHSRAGSAARSAPDRKQQTH